MNIPGIVGLIVSIATAGIVIMMGGNVSIFINIPSIVFILGMGCGLELMASNFREFFRALRAATVLIAHLPVESLRPQDASILREFSSRLYLAGVVGTLIGWIQILATLDSFEALWPALSVSLLAIFYAFLIAEIMLRPAAQRIDFLLAQEEE